MSLPTVELSPLSVAELRTMLFQELDIDGLPSPWSLALHHRQAAARWRTPRRSDVLAHTRRLLQACELGSPASLERAREALAWLVALRDVEEVQVEETWHVLPALDRILWLGAGAAVLLGCGEDYLRLGTPLPGAAGRAALARWLAPDQAKDLAVELDEWSLSDWLGPPEYQVHARRRRGRDLGSLAELWQVLVEDLEVHGPTASGAVGVRVIAGRPGDYFGRHHQGSARWRPVEESPDGTWCGARPGYQDGHLHPCLVEVRGGAPTRALDLYSMDELQWGLLARGAATGDAERLRLEGTSMQQTCALPAQLARALQCFCAQAGWTWTTQPGAADPVAQELAALGSLELERG